MVNLTALVIIGCAVGFVLFLGIIIANAENDPDNTWGP